MERLDHGDVELELLVGDPFHPGLGVAEVLDEVEELALGGGDMAAGRGRDEEVAEVGDQLGREPGEVLACLRLRRDNREHRARVAQEKTASEPGDRLQRREPEDVHHIVRGDFFAAECDHLVEHALGVAEPALGTARDRGCGGGVERDRLAFGDERKVLRDEVGGDPAEVEPLAPAGDRGRQLLRLGRREDKLHMRRRLLKGFEQRVERGRREHVDLVNEVDFVGSARRRVGGVVPKVADVVHAVVACAVNFDDVEAPSVGDLLACVADPAGSGRRTVDAVERLREDPRGRGLADPARTDKKIRLRKPVCGNPVLQRTCDVVLPDNLVECLGAVFACENPVAHAGDTSGPAAGHPAGFLSPCHNWAHAHKAQTWPLPDRAMAWASCP